MLQKTISIGGIQFCKIYHLILWGFCIIVCSQKPAYSQGKENQSFTSKEKKLSYYLDKAERYFSIEEFDTSLIMIDSMLAINAKPSTWMFFRPIPFYLRGKIYLLRDEYETAKSEVLKGLHLIKSEDFHYPDHYDYYEEQASLLLGEVYYHTNKFDSAAIHYSKVENFGLLDNEISALEHARYSFRAVADYQSAISKANEVIGIAISEENHQLHARAKSELAIIYQILGELERAASIQKEALNIAKEKNFSYEIVDGLINLADIYLELGQDSVANTQLSMAYDSAQYYKLQGLLSYLETLFGEQHLGAGNYEKAISHLHRALEINESEGWYNSQLNVVLKINKGHLYLDQPHEALKILESKQHLLEGNISFSNKILFYSSSAETYKKLGKIQKAYEALETAKELQDQLIRRSNQIRIFSARKTVKEREVIELRKREQNDLIDILGKEKDELYHSLVIRGRNIIIVIIVLGSLSVLLTLIGYRLRRRKEESIKNTAILEQELDKYRKKESIQHTLHFQKKIKINIHGRRISAGKITHIEKKDTQVTVHIKKEEKPLKVWGGLKAFKDNKLPHDLFFQCHRAHVVNLLKITRYERGGTILFMKGGKEVPVSKGKRKMLADILEEMSKSHNEVEKATNAIASKPENRVMSFQKHITKYIRLFRLKLNTYQKGNRS